MKSGKLPDRWTRLIDTVEVRWRDSRTNGTVHLISSGNAKQLLRKEHAATVRAVKRMIRTQLAHKQAGSVMSDRQCYYCQALDDLLAWLDSRKQ